MRNALQTDIRLASLADAKAVSRFAIDAFIDTYAEVNEPADVQAYVDASLSESATIAALTNPRVHTLIAEKSDAVRGYAQLSSMRDPGCDVGESALELARLYIAAEWKGTGLANALMARVYATARDLGAHRLWLGVWEQNPRAIRYYEKNGFRKVGTIGFLFGSTPQSDWVMVRPLRDD